MFNKTYHHIDQTTVTPVTRIVEKTITPDKVTEMYDQVKREVEESFIRAYKIESNTIKGVMVEMHESPVTRERKIYCRFTINGEEFIESIPVGDNVRTLSKEKMFNKFFELYKARLGVLLLKATIEINSIN